MYYKSHGYLSDNSLICLFFSAKLTEDQSKRDMKVIGTVLWTLGKENLMYCGRQCVGDDQCVAMEFVRTVPECNGYSLVTGSGSTQTGTSLYYLL